VLTLPFLKLAQMFALYESDLAPSIFEPKDGHLLFELRHLSGKEDDKAEIVEISLREEEISSALHENVWPVYWLQCSFV
jgi:hypothetical protein